MKSWARVLVLALFVAVPAAAQLNPYNPFVGGKNKVRWDKFEWKVFETPHFKISYYDRVEPSLEKIASYAESAYDEIAHKLNYQVLKPIPIICYATHAEFEQTNIMVGFIPEGVGAFATPVRNRMVLPIDLPDRELQGLLQHELTHIFQYEIFFGGRRGRAIYARPPLWFMEGMASYFGDDESTRDEMYMRDAAMSDKVPSVSAPPRGFLAYRFGHKIFEYIEEEWGDDVVRDFVFSFRGNFGGQVGRPVGKTLNMDIEEFDAAFRTWLRRKYQIHGDRGVPREFGRRFRIQGFLDSHQTSPAISPSGDLVAAFTTYKGDVDVALFGVPDRRLYKNLTKGNTTKYQYLVAQGLTVGPAEGRDLAFSPDGNHVAVFARTERTRSLLLLDVLHGGIDRRYNIDLPVDQAAQPAYSPDGRTVAFHAVKEGQFDIYLLDLETGAISNLTDDARYDAAPTFSPDGSQVVYTSKEDENGKLVRLYLDDPSRREQLTFGPGEDDGAAFSPDGERLYFSSDRQDGIFDIYRLDLDTRHLTRLTHLVGGAINPVAAKTLEGERVGFQAYSSGIWGLYSADANQGEDVGISEPPAQEVHLKPFVPAVSIAVDPEKGQKVKRRKFFLEDAGAFVGVDTTNQVLGQAYVTLSDQYGDRRISLLLNTIDTFSNFQIAYFNLEPRLQWGVTIYDYRTYYITGFDPIRGNVTSKQQTYRFTAAEFTAQYPFSTYYRASVRGGLLDRQYAQPFIDPGSGELVFTQVKNQSPYVGLGLAGDTTMWRRWGPHKGARWETRYYYGYDLDGGGTLTSNVEIDARAYVPLSQRNELAFRFWAGYANGNQPWIYSFGGLDTLRGYPTRSLSGNRTTFVNLEWRFPLVDRMDLAFLRLSGIRGRLFFDIGAAWWEKDGVKWNMFGESGFTFIEDGRLVDGVSSYGFGLDINLLGLPMHFDWVKIWDLKDVLRDTQVDFWIGARF